MTPPPAGGPVDVAAIRERHAEDAKDGGIRGHLAHADRAALLGVVDDFVDATREAMLAQSPSDPGDDIAPSDVRALAERITSLHAAVRREKTRADQAEALAEARMVEVVKAHARADQERARGAVERAVVAAARDLVAAWKSTHGVDDEIEVALTEAVGALDATPPPVATADPTRLEALRVSVEAHRQHMRETMGRGNPTRDAIVAAAFDLVDSQPREPQ